MPKVQFIGRILPEAHKVTAVCPEIKWQWEEEGIELIFNIKILASVIIIECDSTKYEVRFFAEFHRRAYDLARATVNLGAFATGRGAIVSLDCFIDASGESGTIVQQDPRLAPLVASYSLDTSRRAEYGDVFRTVVGDPNLIFCLRGCLEMN
jgi:hypothetical protein